MTKHMSLSDEIDKLDKLKQKGVISKKEFDEAKASLISNENSLKINLKFDPKEWAMFIHLSLFLGYIIPLAGHAVALVLWQTKKENPFIDHHGRAVINWIITQVIYWIFLGLLCFIIVGMPLVFIFGIIVIILPVFGAIRAKDGRAWSYPLTIRFFKETKLQN